MLRRLRGTLRHLLGRVVPGWIAVGVAASPAGCGLTMNQDPRAQAISRIRGACEQLTPSDIDAAVSFVELNRDAGGLGSGNLAPLLDAVPEVASIGDDPDCLKAFLDFLDSLTPTNPNGT